MAAVPVRRITFSSGLLSLLAISLGAAPAYPQLRPLEPAAWLVFDAGQSWTVEVGGGVLQDQRAALAGTVGRLSEFGDYQAAWRTGRIAIEIQGTVLREFRDQARYAPADPVVLTAGPNRSDSGDHGIATLIRLTPDRPSFALLRFGTRLPNSNNRVGLDRDRTDFFATLGGQLRRGPYRAAGEAGIGIWGTQLADHEQSDVLVYTAALRREGALLTAIGSLTGHYTPHWIPLGNADLAETRIGVQVGRRVWLRALWVHGLTRFSPGEGLLLTAGATR
jgi:hypothetical protein